MTILNEYNQLFDIMGDGTIKESDTFKIALMAPAHTFLAANTAWGDVSANELAAGNGYVAGGNTLVNVKLLQGSPGSPWNIEWDDLDPAFQATGGDVGPFAHAVVYCSSVVAPINQPLLYSFDLEGSKTAVDGSNVRILVPAGGVGIITKV